MEFFVVGTDGNEYGPVSVPTLNQWAAEGRIGPDADVRESVKGIKGKLHQVPGFVAPLQPASPPPGSFAPQPQSVYVPQVGEVVQGNNAPGRNVAIVTGSGYYDGSGDAHFWSAILIGIMAPSFGIFCSPIVAVIVSIVGIVQAYRCAETWHPQRWVAYLFSIAGLLVSILTIVFQGMLARFLIFGPHALPGTHIYH